MRERLPPVPCSTTERKRVERLAKAMGLSVVEYARLRLGLIVKRSRGRPAARETDDGPTSKE